MGIRDRVPNFLVGFLATIENLAEALLNAHPMNLNMGLQEYQMSKPVIPKAPFPILWDPIDASCAGADGKFPANSDRL